ncbi:dihydropteroate synthase [Lentisphaerota bacterium WC36G]|nr:dihydropteroate synthase [Lentisphaerae bacterium WC36]
MTQSKVFKFRSRQLVSKDIPLIMGIVNATPDSFSDGNLYFDIEKGFQHAKEMIENNVDIIDIGGESTRPGAKEVGVDDEIMRVVPLIERIKDYFPESVVSVDTRKSAVARKALEVGADIINDVSGTEFSEDMIDLAVEFDAGLMIMHMRGQPKNMQSKHNTKYHNIIDEVRSYLFGQAKKAINAGLNARNIVIDPGIGFAKTFEQNIKLIKNAPRFVESDFTVLYGTSRKRFIGEVLSVDDPQKRVFGTIGSSAALAESGVEIIRVHDAIEHKQFFKVYQMCQKF